MTLPPLVFHNDPLPTGVRDPASEFGGKGISLRRLHERGIRIPYGFTIRAEVGRYYLAHARWPAGVWKEVVAAVRRIERQTDRRRDGSSAGPLRLAVRSGAAVSMPGLLRTLLDVAVDTTSRERDHSTTEDCSELRSAIEEVFQSWNCDAARHFRATCAVDEAMATAVTVQEMIPCTASGVLFTRSPDTNDDSLIVEAIAGSGAALVAGQATPYRWTIRRGHGTIPCSNELAGPLTELAERLPELYRVGLELEAAFGEPLDVEWGLDDAGLVFFQARPLVSSGKGAAEQDDREVYVQRERARLHQLADGGARCWVRHNLSETLPLPTPLTWSLWQSFMSGSGGLGTLYRRLGYRPGGKASEGFLTLIGGRIYADPDGAADMFGPRWPLTYDRDELRGDPSAIDRAPHHFDPARLDPFFLWRLPLIGWHMWQAQRCVSRQLATAARRFEEDIVPQFLARLEQERTVVLADQSTEELLTTLSDRRRWVMDEFGPESLLPAMLGGMSRFELLRQVDRVLGPEAALHLVDDLVPAGDVELSRRQQELLTRLSSDAGRTAFLEEFGHRAVGEMELAVPRWRETPDRLGDLAGPATSDGEIVKPVDRPAAHEQLRRSFADAGAASLFDSAACWFERCWELLPYRDRGKHLFLMGYELLREVTEALGDRLELGDEVYLLKVDEWQDLIAGADMQSTIRRRRTEAAVARGLQLPDFIDADQLDDLYSRQPTRPTTFFQQGTPLVGGQGAGIVRSLAALADQQSVDAPTVLVCESLEPALAPLLRRVAAVIVERGGGLSHSAILARQFGVPMVRLPNAMQLIPDGREILIDGHLGRIEIVSEEPA